MLSTVSCRNTSKLTPALDHVFQTQILQKETMQRPEPQDGYSTEEEMAYQGMQELLMELEAELEAELLAQVEAELEAYYKEDYWDNDKVCFDTFEYKGN
jgi:hypothetical protein